MQIKQITAQDTYPLRQKILRPGLPYSACKFEGDDDEQTFHLGAFVDNQLVSVASFFYCENQSFDSPNQYQLRGMATLEGHRGQGLSSELLKVALPIIKQNFCDLVWCNARTSAEGFYKKVGFEKASDEFIIPEVGPHLLMYHNL